MNLSMIIGDTNIYDLSVTRSNIPVDLTLSQITMTIRRPSDNVAVITKTIGDGIMLVDAPGGKAQISIPPSDTVSPFADGGYKFDIKVIEASGVVSTVAYGSMQAIKVAA